MTDEISATVDNLLEQMAEKQEDDDDIVFDKVKNVSEPALDTQMLAQNEDEVKTTNGEANGILKTDEKTKKKQREAKQSDVLGTNQVFKYSRIFKKVSPDGNLVSSKDKNWSIA